MKGKTIKINNHSIFYREAGNPENETILLLHGFPSSSHMYRGIINELSNKYHLIAPDYIGFGLSDIPLTSEFDYTFEDGVEPSIFRLAPDECFVASEIEDLDFVVVCCGVLSVGGVNINVL